MKTMNVRIIFVQSAMAVLFFAASQLAAQGSSAASSTGDPRETGRRQLIQTRGGIFTTRVDPIALALPASDAVFQFVIFGDRTGGEPAGLKFLRQAVHDTNLLDPDLVMTVGDLIQGYNRPNEWIRQMNEYREIMAGLKMNWFPVAGNHDIYWDFRDESRPKIHHEANYEKHFGPLWYAFEHKQVGFIVMYSDEGDLETGEKGFNEGRLQNVSPAQMKFLETALDNLASCKQVFVFLHHPRWLGGGYTGSNWPDVHRRLVEAKNVTAVFGGHIHQMTFQGPTDGIEYYTLAATGAHLAMDSPELGYLHHFNVVTVREYDLSVTSIPVGAVSDPKSFTTEFLNDVELVRTMRPQRHGDKILLSPDGSTSGKYSLNLANPGKSPIEVTVIPKLEGGWQTVPDHQHIVIAPEKSEGMSFYYFRKGESAAEWPGFAAPTFEMSVDYLHSSARIRLPAVSVPLDLSVASDTDSFATDVDRCLELRGVQSGTVRSQIFSFPNDSVRIESLDVDLPQGPFTLEAWIYPTSATESRAVVAKTQNSEYALFLHEGRATFDVHLEGRYVSPQTESAITLNRWTHLAGVYDGQQVRLYVDGKLNKSLAGSGQRTTNELPLFIGADPDQFGNPNREFAGMIDEVRLSSVARYGDAFEPAQRFERDGQTLLLMHMDKSYGPYLLSDSRGEQTILKLGKSRLVPK
jgi:hypothetical protein